MSLVLGVICATILGYIGYYWYKHVQIGQKLSWMPTVRGWPIVGNGLEFTNTETLLADITRLIPKKEKMVFLTHLGISNIFTTDYDLIELVLSSQSILKKSSDYRYAKNWLGTGLLTADGGKWKSRRRITTPAFHFSILEQFVEVFESNGNIFIEKLKNVVDKNSIDVYPFITLYALDVICETAMGVKVNAQQDANSAYVQNVKLMCKISLVRTISVIKRFDITYPLTLDYYREKRALKLLHGATNSVIDKRRSTINEDIKTEVDELGRKKRLAFLDILLRSTTADGQPLTREDIREEVDTFMFEGHDTTASAMTFCVHFLSEHPEVQKRIIEEQQEIFGDDIYRPSTIKDLNEMKYLECVIKETLRICPSVPMYGRHVQEDFYFKGNLIPKGVNIVVFDYGVLHDPDYYPNPEKFDPSRFEQVDGKRPYQYIPFSAGPRNCIGQKFAMLEMKSTLSKLLRNFEISPTVPKHKLILVSEAVLKSANGVRVKLATRKW